jgi:hypothetical protein
MEIEHNKNTLNSPMNIASTEQKSHVQSTSKIEQNNADKQLVNIENKAATASVQLSSEGKLVQAIDETSDKIDSILEKHLTKEQKQSIDGIYKQLEGIFESDNLSKKQEKTVDALFEQVNQIYNTSIEKLSSGEHEAIDKFANKMNDLSAQLAQSENNDVTASKQNNDGRNTRNSEAAEKAITGSELSDVAESKKKSKKKALTVAQLNALSVAELNKLSPRQVKKLNAKQLNKLNASLLNMLALPQLKQLSNVNIGKLNQMQQDKLT